jgi:hypothetical protein
MKMAVFWDVSEVLNASIIRAIILYGVKTFETSVCLPGYTAQQNDLHLKESCDIKLKITSTKEKRNAYGLRGGERRAELVTFQCSRVLSY